MISCDDSFGLPFLSIVVLTFAIEIGALRMMLEREAGECRKRFADVGQASRLSPKKKQKLETGKMPVLRFLCSGLAAERCRAHRNFLFSPGFSPI